ncbi:Sec7 domain-containing protein [Apiospora arundinis]
MRTLAILDHRVSCRNPSSVEDQIGCVFFGSLRPLDQSASIAASALVPVRTSMVVRSLEEPVLVEAGEGELPLMSRSKQSLLVLVERAPVHIVVGCELAERVQEHLVRPIDRPEHLKLPVRMPPAGVVVDAHRPFVARPADDYVAKVHVLGRVVRGLRPRHAAANADEHGHADAGKGLEYGARDAAGIDVAGHAQRAGRDDDVVAGQRAAGLDVVVVGRVVVGGVVLLVEHQARQQQFEVGHGGDPRDVVVGPLQLRRRHRGRRLPSIRRIIEMDIVDCKSSTGRDVAQ